MDRLLDRRDFPGPVLERAGQGASFVGAARFDGGLVCTLWPRREVERLLPPELTLAHSAGTADVHPLLFVFGQHTASAVIFAGFKVPMGVRYTEFAVAIPYVSHRRGRYLHTYVPRMYSSYAPAVRNGNQHYGFGKAFATVAWQGPIATLTAPPGDLLWHAAIEPAGEWESGTRCALPGFAGLRTAFTMPIVGRRADGTYVGSYFGLDFDDALVRPARCAISIDAPLLEHLPVRRCYAAPGGAFEVRGMTWSLTWPGACTW
jgi:hypothetical protein